MMKNSVESANTKCGYDTKRLQNTVKIYRQITIIKIGKRIY